MTEKPAIVFVREAPGTGLQELVVVDPARPEPVKVVLSKMMALRLLADLAAWVWRVEQRKTPPD